MASDKTSDAKGVFPSGARFWKGNIHTHSNRSDGALPAEEVCRRYRERGYDFLTLSDHFLERYDFPITDTTPYRTDRFTTILGAEVHAPSTTTGELWHILAVGLPDDFAPTGPSERGGELAQRCAEAGAFVSIVHPQWYGLTEADAAMITAAHSVEVYNHTCQVLTDRPDGWYLLDRLCQMGRILSATAVDDAHFHAPDAFGGWVMVAADANEPDLLVEALKAGRNYSTQGPSLNEISIEGGRISVACSPVSAVFLLGSGSRGLHQLGADITSASFPLDRFKDERWARITVVDADGKRAWSNPLTLA